MRFLSSVIGLIVLSCVISHIHVRFLSSVIGLIVLSCVISHIHVHFLSSVISLIILFSVISLLVWQTLPSQSLTVLLKVPPYKGLGRAKSQLVSGST